MNRLSFIILVALGIGLTACSTKGKETENTNGNMAFEVTLLKDKTDSEGARTISVRPSGVCSVQIDITVKDGIIRNVTYTGGCDGNTQGVERLVAGMPVQEAIDKLQGIDCGGKGTSCPDQLTKALKLLLK